MRTIALAALVGLGGPALAQRPEGAIEVRVEQRSGRPGDARVEVLSDLPMVGERLVFGGMARGLGERVSISVKGAPLREALAEVFRDAGVDHVVDEDVPKDGRVTLTVENVRRSTVLDLISQSLGIGWRYEMRDGRGIVRITARPLPGIIARALTNLPEVVGEAVLGGPMLYWGAPETRSTFACAHCKGQVQVLLRRQLPRCPKCDRTFQREWQFCPFDGARRPPAPGGWRFCPLCGKAAERERPAAQRSAS